MAKMWLDYLSLRFPLYYLFLQNSPRKYSKIMLTDVRDVLFQVDPFNFNQENCLCCFLEDNIIVNCPFNSKWIYDGFGDIVAKKFKNKRIICAGISIGSYPVIMDYLKKMIDYLMVLNNYNETGNDQAVHNYIVYEGLIKNIRLYENNNGPVLTMHYLKEQDLHINKEGLVVDNNNIIINILHQYDRLRLEVKNRMLTYRLNVLNASV
jgi:hypothetical protein